MRYIVLFPLIPDQGEPILPARPGDDPVIVDDAALQQLYDGTPREMTADERTGRHLATGTLVKADEPEKVPEAKKKLAAFEARGPATPYS